MGLDQGRALGRPDGLGCGDPRRFSCLLSCGEQELRALRANTRLLMLGAGREDRAGRRDLQLSRFHSVTVTRQGLTGGE